MNSNSRLFIYGEAAVFCLIFLYAGLYFRPADPFFWFSSYQLYLPFALILTLAGGTGAGLIALLFAAAMSRFYYTPYPYQSVLWTALITLAAGEFKIFWDRKIHMYMEERDYFREKLRDLTRNFILLKLSHERLENNYILRPVSIRGSLQEIRTLLLKQESEACQSLMNFMANFYGLESAALFIRRTAAAKQPSGRLARLFKDRPDSSWQEAGRTGRGAELDLSDPLIKLALAKRDAAFFTMSQLKSESKSAYIAVIPYFDSGDEPPQALLAIKDIPFLQLNRDNLLKLAMYLSFFMSEFVETERFSAAAAAFPMLNSAIFKELARLQKMRRDFKVESVLICFHINYGDISKEVSAFIESEVRGFDMSCAHCPEHCLVLVILPFTSYANCAVFTGRVEEKVRAGFSSFGGTLEKKVLPITGMDVLALLEQIKCHDR